MLFAKERKKPRGTHPFCIGDWTFHISSFLFIFQKPLIGFHQFFYWPKKRKEPNLTAPLHQYTSCIKDTRREKLHKMRTEVMGGIR